MTRSLKVRLLPSLEQREVFRRWIGASRFIYNAAIERINGSRGEPSSAGGKAEEEARGEEGKGRVQEQKEGSFTTGGERLKPKVDMFAAKRELTAKASPFISEENPWLAETPNHTRQGAVKDAFRAFSNGCSACRDGRIRKFELKFRSKRAVQQTCVVDVTHFKAEEGSRVASLYPRILREQLRLREKWRSTSCELRLQLDGRNRWWLVVPLERPKRERFREWTGEESGGSSSGATSVSGGESQTPGNSRKRKRAADRAVSSSDASDPSVFSSFSCSFPLPETARVAALDPGVRSFLTGYDPSGKSFSLGESRGGNDGVNRLEKLNQMASKLSRLARSGEGEAGGGRKGWTLRRKAERVRRRVRGLVDDMHRKVIRWLLDRYDVLLLPTFEVAEMVRKEGVRGKRRVIRKKTARQLLSLSFFKFCGRLTARAEEEGAKVVRVSEAYTSKTCGRCGWENGALGGSKVFRCQRCELTADRDEHAARNIFLRFLVRAGN